MVSQIVFIMRQLVMWGPRIGARVSIETRVICAAITSTFLHVVGPQIHESVEKLAYPLDGILAFIAVMGGG